METVKYFIAEIEIPKEDFIPIFIAEMDALGFEGFEELPNCLKAYIDQTQFDRQILDDLLERYQTLSECKLSSLVEMKEQNWNAVWESNFEPIMIEDKIVVKAPFHNIEKEFKHTLLIEPKMSFGTGHHETTHMMMEQLLELDLNGKTVLDYGCGTGILGILAGQLGATQITAIDIDEWAYTNTLENIERNNSSGIEVFRGDIFTIEGQVFDIILANINRNVILDTFTHIDSAFREQILFSGLMESDFSVVNSQAESFGFQLISKKQMGDWLMLHYKKAN